MNEAKSKITGQERDARVLELYEQLLEIEQRLIPTGLHVFGEPGDNTQREDMLRMVASFDRPEAGARPRARAVRGDPRQAGGLFGGGAGRQPGAQEDERPPAAVRPLPLSAPKADRDAKSRAAAGCGAGDAQDRLVAVDDL